MFIGWLKMELKVFNKYIKNMDISLKPYIAVVSIFICIIILIVFFNNRLEEYYVTDSLVVKNEVKIIVNYNDLEKITNNKKLKIEGDIFTYKVVKINDLVIDNSFYKEVFLLIENINEKLLIDNNVIKLRIITDKTTIISYFWKIVKGEWSIINVSNDELKELDGGGLSLLGVAGIVAGAIFLIGVVDGVIALKE